MASEVSLDADKVRRFVEAEVPGFENAEVKVRRHPGGHSCETWRLNVNGERWILRRPPRGKVQQGASNMAREYRIISALRDSPVPVPKTIALGEDPDVIGAPFFIMEEVDGVVLRQGFSSEYEDSPQRRAAIGKSVVDTLVAIHSVDWRAIGLERHGKPETFLQRNLSLMYEQWLNVKQRPIDAIEKIAEYLRGHVPECSDATIVHGDYKLDNLMWKRDELAEVAAVLDWEISTLADPLVDLGWLRGFWCDPADRRALVMMGQAPQADGGFLSRDELVEYYADQSGRDLELLPWFEAFGMWKIAIIMEASYARYLNGHSDDTMFAMLDLIVPALADAGLEALSRAKLL
ncbi:MAG: phosphotransferase family protein [Candidatus Binatia bacterium]